MISKRILVILMVTLAAAGTTKAAEMSVSSMSMPAGSTATLQINGDIAGESTFGLTIVAELVPQAGAVGMLEFTSEPPVDIVQLGDPWPGVGTFSPFDTAGAGSLVLNGAVDDNGTFLAGPVTFSGAIVGFPVVASGGALGTWEVLLSTGIGSTEWQGLATTFILGTITVIPAACFLDADCDDANDCTDNVCSSGFCSHPPLVAGTACGNQIPQGLCDNPDICDGAGFCGANLELATTVCRPSAAECDLAEFCTGIDGACPSDLPVVDGTPCIDDGNECTGDACSAGLCDHPELAPGTPCSDDLNECTRDECNFTRLSGSPATLQINGDIAGESTFGGTIACVHSPLAPGTSCGNPMPDGLCDSPDTCDGLGLCLSNLELVTTVCRASTDECDPAELCTGVDGPCPGDQILADGTTCSDDGNDCTGDNCLAGSCSHQLLTSGEACDDQNVCTSSDACDQLGMCAGSPIPNCDSCQFDLDCDDGASCTFDECVNSTCVHGDLCQNNFVFCDGVEICNVQLGVCESSGDPCPGSCSEVDGCLMNPPLSAPFPHAIRKNRFFSIDPNNTIAVSLRVELLELACSETGKKCNSLADCKACVGGSNNGSGCSISSDCPSGACILSGESCDQQGPPVLLGWMSDPVEAGGDALPGTFTSDIVEAQPAARIWTESVVHIGACEIAPVRTYAISATTDGTTFSDPLVLGTIEKPQDKFWGDVVGNFNGVVWSAPNGLVGVDDVNAIIKFLTNKPAPHVTVVDLVGSAPTFVNTDVNASDLQIILKAFSGDTYPPFVLVSDGYPANGDVTQCP